MSARALNADDLVAQRYSRVCVAVCLLYAPIAIGAGNARLLGMTLGAALTFLMVNVLIARGRGLAARALLAVGAATWGAAMLAIQGFGARVCTSLLMPVYASTFLLLRWSERRALWPAVAISIGALVMIWIFGANQLVTGSGLPLDLSVQSSIVLSLAMTLALAWVSFSRDQSKEHDVIRATEALSDRVRQRTADLAHATDELHAELARRRRLERELMLAHRLESVGKLAAGIAHEINSPIQYVGHTHAFLGDAANAIARYLRAAKEAADTGRLDAPDLARWDSVDTDFVLTETPGVLERIHDGVAQIASIVESIRALSHPGTEDRTPADVNTALRAALAVCRNELKDVAGVTLELGDLPDVHCRIGQLQQAFLHILINAVEAIRARREDDDRAPGGEIFITTDLVDDDVRVRFRDNGCGMPPEVLERVLDPFFSTKEAGVPQGRGLTITRALVVDGHGGRLGCDSELGRGTTVTITLPVGAPT